MMSHIVNSCPLTKLAGVLSKLHSADDDAVAWLTNYGSPQRMHMSTTSMMLNLWLSSQPLSIAAFRLVPHCTVS